ncbi:MAG: hypothetical protein LBU12_06840 [Deltaproteobacteria bacterium]|nr:hypothetical protein [Deltaproteobacteria bacterium]
MPEIHRKLSSIEKICHDSECSEKIASLKPEHVTLFKTFTYCPYCAEELTLVCQSCREQLNSSEFKYCPWCGVNFADAETVK